MGADVQIQSVQGLERFPPSEGIRDFFDSSVDALFVISVDLNGVYWLDELNQSFADLVGVPKRAAQGKRLRQFLPSEVETTIEAGLQRCIDSGTVTSFDLNIRASGKVQQWTFKLKPIVGFMHRRTQILGQGRDVTDDYRRVIGSELTYALLDRLGTAMRDVLYVFDRDERRNVYVNGRVYDVLGYRPEEIRDMQGEFLTQLIYPHDLAKLIAHYAKFDSLGFGEAISIDVRAVHASGRLVWLSSQDTVLARDDRNRAHMIVGCLSDTTDRRHATSDMKRITKRLLHVQDEERRRIARELHDSTAQQVVAVGIGLSRLDMIAAREADVSIAREDVRRILSDMRIATSEAQHEIRALSYLLHPPILESMGLGEALRRFVVGFARRTGVRAKLTISGGFSCRSRDIATALMRIAQEALINVFRHAEASAVEVRLGTHQGHWFLEIEDDGKGVATDEILMSDSDVASIGIGIPGMRARVRQFHGELHVVRGRRGLLVRASVPRRGARLDP